MTTIIGIKTTRGPIDAVVMAADAAIVHSPEQGMPDRISYGSKFIYESSARWMMLHSGLLDKKYHTFCKNVLGAQNAQQTYGQLSSSIAPVGKKRKRSFAQVAKLFKAQRDRTSSEKSTVLLGISTEDGPSLWKFGTRGNLIPPNINERRHFHYFCAGSGDTYVNPLFRQALPKGFSLSIYDAIDIIKAGLRASQDKKLRNGTYEKGIYCKGYQLAIITHQGIISTALFRQNEYTAFEASCESLVKLIEKENGIKPAPVRRVLEIAPQVPLIYDVNVARA